MRAKLFTLHVLLLLAGCSSVPLLYQIEIQQGNIITHEMMEKLKPGMTRSQVRFVLGSPMISDAFHDNRWDYVYRLEQEGKLIEQHRITVFFEDDKLTHTEGRLPPAPVPPKVAVPVKPVVEKKPDTMASPKPVAPSSEQIPPQSAGADSERAGPVIQKVPDTSIISKPVAPSSVQASSPSSSPSGAAELIEVDQPRGERGLFGGREAKQPKQKKGFFGKMLEK